MRKIIIYLLQSNYEEKSNSFIKFIQSAYQDQFGLNVSHVDPSLLKCYSDLSYEPSEHIYDCTIRWSCIPRSKNQNQKVFIMNQILKLVEVPQLESFLEFHLLSFINSFANQDKVDQNLSEQLDYIFSFVSEQEYHPLQLKLLVHINFLFKYSCANVPSSVQKFNSILKEEINQNQDNHLNIKKLSNIDFQ